MEIKFQGYESHEQGEQKVPLLKYLAQAESETEKKTLIQQAISQTFQSTAHLADLLPTGTVLCPIFTNQGECDSVGQSMTAALVLLCGLSCFITNFTDSFRDKDGNVCYGLATVNGLWVIDGESASLTPESAAKYKLRFMDFVHALKSVLVFAAVALFDENVVSCFYPVPSTRAQEIRLCLLGLGFFAVGCLLFFLLHAMELGSLCRLRINHFLFCCD